MRRLWLIADYCIYLYSSWILVCGVLLLLICNDTALQINTLRRRKKNGIEIRMLAHANARKHLTSWLWIACKTTIVHYSFVGLFLNWPFDYGHEWLAHKNIKVSHAALKKKKISHIFVQFIYRRFLFAIQLYTLHSIFTKIEWVNIWGVLYWSSLGKKTMKRCPQYEVFGLILLFGAVFSWRFVVAFNKTL